ncbi:hypothetical protein Trydic_g3069 [Trypoxylus dichotomus]
MTLYVKNADNFIDILRQQHLESTDMLISFDVTSLFTQIPINKTVDIIRNKHQLEDHLINLIEHRTYSFYNGQRHRQTEGVQVRTALSPILISSCKNLKQGLWIPPSTNTNYGSDMWMILSLYRHTVKINYRIFFHTIHNSIRTKIKFTTETEN